MLGLFESDLKRVRKLRIEYEDIRQRYLYKMNQSQKRSFISSYESAEMEFNSIIRYISEEQVWRWRKMGESLKDIAKQAWKKEVRMAGIGGEGYIPGVDGVALLALECSAKGYRIPQALILNSDIQTFMADVKTAMGRLDV